MNPFQFRTTSLWLSKSENEADASSNQLKIRMSKALNISKAKVALSKLSFDYSFQNISTANNNNYFSYTVDSVDYKVSIDDGLYDTDALNAKLEATMFANKHYLLNASGSVVYYLNMRENLYTNKVSLTASVVPASLPTSWTDPGTFITDGNNKTLQFVIPDTNIATLLGFPDASYPSSPASSTYNIDSTSTPVFDVVSTILVRCNIANSSGSIKSANIIYAFNIPSSSSYPGMTEISIPTQIFHDCASGYFDTIQLDFLDQDFRAIVFTESRHVAQIQILEPL